MHDSEIRYKVVRRMWRDGILESSQYADVDTVADFSVSSSEEGRAQELIQEEMTSNPKCPVVWGIAGEAIALRHDKEQVARYIAKHGGKDEVPWDLKDVIETSESDVASRVAGNN